jgi:hypothetical protein
MTLQVSSKPFIACDVKWSWSTLFGTRYSQVIPTSLSAILRPTLLSSSIQPRPLNCRIGCLFGSHLFCLVSNLPKICLSKESTLSPTTLLRRPKYHSDPYLLALTAPLVPAQEIMAFSHSRPFVFDPSGPSSRYPLQLTSLHNFPLGAKPCLTIWYRPPVCGYAASDQVSS